MTASFDIRNSAFVIFPARRLALMNIALRGNEGDELPTAFAPAPPELAQRQQTFITEIAKDGRNTYGTFSQWDQPADPARGLMQAIEAIEAIKFETTVLAGKPANLPYTSLGTLFKGRDEFPSFWMLGISRMRNHRHRSRLQEFGLCYSLQ